MMNVPVAPINDRQYEDMAMAELLEMVPNYDPVDVNNQAELEAGRVHFPGEPERALHAEVGRDVSGMPTSLTA